MKMVLPSPICSTNVFSLVEVDLPIDWLPEIVVCELSSSRRDSLNAYSEFLRFKIWISNLYSVKNFSELFFFFLIIACWSLRSRCWRSHPSQQNFLRVWSKWLQKLFRRLIFDIDSAALITRLLSFLSLCLLFCFPSWAVRVCDTHEELRILLCTRYVQKSVRATSECMYRPGHIVVACTCERNPQNVE